MPSLYLVPGKNTEYIDNPKYQRNGSIAKSKTVEEETPFMYQKQQGYFLSRIDSIENEIKELQSCMNELVKKIEEVQGIDEVIKLRAVPYEKAKEEIASFFREHDGEEIGYDDLMNALNLDLKTVWLACNQLEKEGKIG